MGMVMNKFSMLKEVRDDISRGDTSYKRFVLSAIIVHDPTDSELTDTIREKFRYWSERTGDNFLFVTFVSPGDCYRNDHFYSFNKRLLIADSSITQETENDTMPLLRDFLGLQEHGSYLMLAKDLSSNDFHKILIDSTNIEGKLDLITKYCDDEASGTNHSPDGFTKLLNALKADDRCEELTIELITQFSALTSQFPDAFDRYQKHYYEKQLQAGRELLSRFKLKIESKITASGEIEYVNEEFIHYAYAKSYFDDKSNSSRNKSLRSERYRSSFDDDVMMCRGFGSYFGEERVMRNIVRSSRCRNFELLNDYEQKIYRTYQMISNPDPLDAEYATPVMCLARIIESQLHNSYCQLLRMAHDIEMPRYFNKYCKKRGEVLVNNDDAHSININESQSGSGIDEEPQKGVPMGKLIWAYRRWFEPNAEVYSRTLFDFFRRFNNKYRNNAAHIGEISEKDFFEVKDCFREFMERHIVELNRIKENVLSGNLLGGAGTDYHDKDDGLLYADDDCW